MDYGNNSKYSHQPSSPATDRGFSDFIHTAASFAPSGSGNASSPSFDHHSAAAPGHGGKNKPSPGELLSSAKVMLDAAKTKMHHGESEASEAEKIDKAKMAGAAADVLAAAKHYGKLDEKKYGKYMQKAEEYLQKYEVKHAAGNGSVPVSNSPPPPPPSHSSAETTHEENKYGKYFKIAEGYLKKH